MSRLKILLADDHAILREGLAMLVNAQPDMEVVGEASTGAEAFDLACRLQPDIAVLDVTMPVMGGAEAAENIRETCPDVRVIALTRHSDPAYLRRLLRAGASGYVLKKSAAATLIGAIREVAGGGSYIEPEMREPVGGELLSAREEEVLRAIAWGRSNKEVAAELGLSVKTVESYRATATGKLTLRTRADIVRYAVGRGWLEGDQAPGA